MFKHNDIVVDKIHPSKYRGVVLYRQNDGYRISWFGVGVEEHVAGTALRLESHKKNKKHHRVRIHPSQ